MTDEYLDALLGLACEQYDPKPAKIERVKRRILGKAVYQTEQSRQMELLFQNTFSVFSEIMQQI